MNLESLKKEVRPDVAARIEQLYNEFQRVAPRTSIDAFLAHLHTEGLIDSEKFLELHLRGDLQLMEFDAVLAARGVTTTQGAPEETGEMQPLDRPSSRYEQLGELGRGAMGEVHVARDRELGRKVAYKRMLAKGASRRGRFLREIQITAQLEHPGIIPVYGLEVDEEGHLAYAMKLVKGESLRELLDEAKAAWDNGTEPPDRCSVSTLLEHFVKVCDAMSYAHSRGVLHRDLKPANVMVGAYREVYVMDWGVARAFEAAAVVPTANLEASQLHLRPDQGSQFERTRVGVAVGTPAFMSPEQASGLNDELDHRSDIYSLGLILFELITLKRPIVGKTGMMVLVNASRGDREAITHHVEGKAVHPDLVAIVEKATQKDREARYQDAGHLAEDLRRALRGHATAAPPDNHLGRVLHFIGNHREATLRTLLLVVFALAVATLLALRTQERANRRERGLTALVTAVSGQAHLIDSRLLRYQGLLEGLAAAAERSLAHRNPEGADGVYLDSALSRQPPPDFAPAPVYGTQVSLEWPVASVGAAASASQAQSLIRQLAPLRPVLRGTLLRSQAESAILLGDGDARALLGVDGVPVVRAHVALAAGPLISFPGSAGQPADARLEPWYRAATDGTGPVWGEPFVANESLGAVVPCSRSLRGPEGEAVGVAAIELSLESVRRELLESAALADISEAFLLDPGGRVIARDGDEGGIVLLGPFPLTEVVEAAARQRSGIVEEGDRVSVFERLESVGWSYVVVGRASAFL